MNNFTTGRLIYPPKVVGYWVLPGSLGSSAFKIACYSKPKWFTIKMMKLILDFKYENVYERTN